MKTIEEACLATFVYDRRDRQPMDVAEIKARALRDVERWKGIDDEIRNCRWIQYFVAQMIALTVADTFTPGEALMATCCQMIQVGMEMARPPNELPDPAKSVPGRREAGYTGI